MCLSDIWATECIFNRNQYKALIALYYPVAVDLDEHNCRFHKFRTAHRHATKPDNT